MTTIIKQHSVPLMGPADPGTSTSLMGTAESDKATPVMVRGVSR